jgi:membrane associated rhomboid family serine protease
VDKRWWTAAPGTLAMAALLCAVFAAEVVRGAVGSDAALLRMGAFPDTAILDGQWWRVFSYAFLHFAWWHLLANVALLIWVGRIVERRLGTPGWAAVYAAGIVVPGAMLLLVRTVAPRDGATVGASGAICALLAAAIVLVRQHRRDRRLSAGLWGALAVVAALSFLPGVCFMGHASGLVTGALVASILAGL